MSEEARIIAACDADAASLTRRYEAIPSEAVHGDLLDLVPRGGGLLALDVGAGPGRDAAWLAALGQEVVAVEPSAGMRSAARRLHPDPRIRWVDDKLPDLLAVHRLGVAFDPIVLSAVWAHVRPTYRTRAFRKLATPLRPGGSILTTLREGPGDPCRPTCPAPLGEVGALAPAHGLSVIRVTTGDDRLDRPDLRRTSLCLRLPNDGAGALPLLRGVILKDEKSSTYKLALLRAVARVADATPALATPRLDQDVVDLPPGIVALDWARMYLPLVAAGLPRTPGDSGPDGLAFAKAGFRGSMAQGVVDQDLRVGARFGDERAIALARAMSEARSTIVDMPARHMRLPNFGAAIFEVAPRKHPRVGRHLDADALGAFGTLAVPGHVWRTLRRLGA